MRTRKAFPEVDAFNLTIAGHVAPRRERSTRLTRYLRILVGVLVVLLTLADRAATQELAPSIFDSSTPPRPASQIDRLVFDKLSSLGIQPVRCSDAVFVRRAYLDVIGTLPTAEEARQFIQDPDAENKRRALIDHLLERPEFADYWSMKWGDILRIKAEFPINLWPNAAQAYHRWVRSAIAENMPYDKFAREILVSSGSNFRIGQVNFYRAVQNRTPDGIATAVALTFMGARTDAWPADRLPGMAAFFSQVGYKPTREWKEEIVFWKPGGASEDDSTTTNDGASLTAVFPDGTSIELPADRDPRELFADWLITRENPWFTRNIVNRTWAWLLGRGIIHEPDDIRETNPPSNAQLLSYLEGELVESGYDLKHLYRLVLNSNTYQMSSTPRFVTPEAEAHFATYPLRRLEAEVLIDAVNKVTGTFDLYTSAIPEPFTYIPQDKPAIALADGSITSPFLALFGRSARATGMENERANELVPAQSMHMLNSGHIQRKLEKSPALKAIVGSRQKPDEIAEELYLTILSRPPTLAELEIVGKFGTRTARKSGGSTVVKTYQDWMDIAWALINSTEFMYRH